MDRNPAHVADRLSGRRLVRVPGGCSETQFNIKGSFVLSGIGHEKGRVKQVIAVDIYNDESEWSDPFKVTVENCKLSIYPIPRLMTAITKRLKRARRATLPKS